MKSYKSSRLYRAVRNTTDLVWNNPTRPIKRRIKSVTHVFVQVLWEHGPRAWWAAHRHLLLARSLRGKPGGSSPQFQCGGKLVSVLLPSRGRPQGLLHAVSSLIVRCENLESIEILIRLDDDDDSGSHDMASHLRSVFSETIDIQVMVGPRRDGYNSLHEFVDELCAVARGDFFFLFNDDLTMDTEGWDTEIARFRNKFCVLHWKVLLGRKVSLESFHNGFPIVHRKVHQVIGHFSKCGICDTWMEEISRRAGIERSCSIRGTHKQKYGSSDTTAKEATVAWLTLLDKFRSDEMKNLRNADLAKVKAYLDRHGVQLQRTEGAA